MDRIWTSEPERHQFKSLFHHLLRLSELQLLVYKMGIIVPHRIIMKIKQENDWKMHSTVPGI